MSFVRVYSKTTQFFRFFGLLSTSGTSKSNVVVKPSSNFDLFYKLLLISTIWLADYFYSFETHTNIEELTLLIGTVSSNSAYTVILLSGWQKRHLYSQFLNRLQQIDQYILDQFRRTAELIQNATHLTAILRNIKLFTVLYFSSYIFFTFWVKDFWIAVLIMAFVWKNYTFFLLQVQAAMDAGLLLRRLESMFGIATELIQCGTAAKGARERRHHEKRIISALNLIRKLSDMKTEVEQIYGGQMFCDLLTDLMYYSGIIYFIAHRWYTHRSGRLLIGHYLHLIPMIVKNVWCLKIFSQFGLQVIRYMLTHRLNNYVINEIFIVCKVQRF